MEIFIIWILCAIASGMIGARKGRMELGVALGIMFGPIGLVITLCAQGNRKECPACKELIHAEATICPHCRTPARQPTSAQIKERLARRGGGSQG